MENVNKVAEIFEQYGWPGILAIGVLFALWFILQKMLKKNSEDNIKALTAGLKEIAQNMSNQNDFLIHQMTDISVRKHDQIVDLLSKTLVDHDRKLANRHTESVNQRFTVTPKILTKLDSILNYHNAQRAVIIEFHNSKENLNGLSFVWYDVQYERHTRNIVPIKNKCKELQVSGLFDIITEIFSNDGLAIYNKEYIKLNGINSVLYNEIEKELNGIVYEGIYNDNNDLIGLLVLEYIKNEMPENLDIDELAEQASAISTLLNFNHFDEVD